MPQTGLIPQGVAVRVGGKVRLVESLAEFAAIDFRFFADQGLDFIRVIVPALQMAAADFVFFVFFIAGALRALFYFYFWGRRLWFFGAVATELGFRTLVLPRLYAAET